MLLLLLFVTLALPAARKYSDLIRSGCRFLAIDE